VTRAEVEAQIRPNPDALKFFACLRRGGMSDVGVAAAIVDYRDARTTPPC
jgi:hypothetical protein